jgi:hypothetical protein
MESESGMQVAERTIIIKRRETSKCISAALKRHLKTHRGYCKVKKQPSRISIKKSISLKRYYSNHVIWNKG